MSKISIMTVQGTDISIAEVNNNDYICLTDMVKAKDDDSRAADIIKNWIRTRTTSRLCWCCHQQNHMLLLCTLISPCATCW